MSAFECRFLHLFLSLIYSNCISQSLTILSLIETLLLYEHVLNGSNAFMDMHCKCMREMLNVIFRFMSILVHFANNKSQHFRLYVRVAFVYRCVYSKNVYWLHRLTVTHTLFTCLSHYLTETCLLSIFIVVEHQIVDEPFPRIFLII